MAPAAASKSNSLDFKFSDEAWYAVRVEMERDSSKLRVMYCEFPDGRFDETYGADNFKDVKELEGFVRNRFRPTCAQLQDQECGSVVQGMTVSASFVFAQNDLKFYDAVVVHKNTNDHTYDKDGNEECTCKFELVWLAGPNIGNKTLSEIKHICMLQSRDAASDPTLSHFLKVSSEKLKMNSECFGSNVSTAHNSTVDTIVEYNPVPLDCESQVRSTEKRKISKRSIGTSQKLKGGSIEHWGRSGQDKDLGGKCNYLVDPREPSMVDFMLIDNLEKDLSPSAIVNFVYKHLSISCQAQLLPSFSWETCNRGIIIVEGREELQKLADLLENPTHMIMSSRGRPWVLTEKKMRRGTLGSKTGKQKIVSEGQMSDKNIDIGDEIQIFGRRTEEFKRGKELRKLFMEFAEHQRRLHERLEWEERKILEQCNVMYEQPKQIQGSY